MAVADLPLDPRLARHWSRSEYLLEAGRAMSGLAASMQGKPGLAARVAGRITRVAARSASEAIASRDLNNLYRTSLFFVDRQRYRAFCAQYAVMRVVDDRVDNLPPQSRRNAETRATEMAVLEAWRVAVERAYAGQGVFASALDHPDAYELMSNLLESFGRFPAPIQIWRRFFEAMRRDLIGGRFARYTDFLDYARGASGSPTTLYLYLLAGRKTGGQYLPPPEVDIESCGQLLGLFAYLAHILRDLPEDLEAVEGGLLYLAEDDMRAHGVTVELLFQDLASRRGSPPVRSLVKELMSRARAALLEARVYERQLAAQMTKDCAFILRLIVGIYEAVLDRIEACDCDPMGRKHQLKDSDKQALAARLLQS
jgi:presqualene diphosphate synthase